MGMLDTIGEALSGICRSCVKDGVTVYAAQIAIYQAYMEPSVPGISAAPALLTAINKDTPVRTAALIAD